jgi:hypothetical protein
MTAPCEVGQRPAPRELAALRDSEAGHVLGMMTPVAFAASRPAATSVHSNSDWSHNRMLWTALSR